MRMFSIINVNLKKELTLQVRKLPPNKVTNNSKNKSKELCFQKMRNDIVEAQIVRVLKSKSK